MRFPAFPARLRFLTLVLALTGLIPAVFAAPDSNATKPKASSAADAKPAATRSVATKAVAAKPNPALQPTTTAKASDSIPSKASPAKADAPATPDSLPVPLRDLGQKALKVPEKLLFDIVWGGWSFRWVNAGRATLELLPTEEKHIWKIQSLAWCNGFFQSIYPVRDTVISHIDSRGIYPIRFDKRLNEGGYHANITARYNQTAHLISTQDTTFSIDPFTHDVLSAFYFIRTQTLRVGDTLQLAAVSGKKKYKMLVLCHGRETITVPAGEFRTLVVEPILKEDGLFKAKGKLTIWVTDDETHTPVKMQSKIPVGSIKAELISKS
jgi:hypothetical protein